MTIAVGLKGEMMRLIDADVFEKHLEDEWILHNISNNNLTQIGKWLAQEQTIDAVPVIRCKNCKHWRGNTQFCSVFSGLCTAHRMPPDGYCSEAERKEE